MVIFNSYVKLPEGNIEDNNGYIAIHQPLRDQTPRRRDAIGHQCSCGDDFILPWPSATEVAEVLSTLRKDVRKTRDPNVKHGFTKIKLPIICVYIYIDKL